MGIEHKDKQVIISMPRLVYWAVVVPWMLIAATRGLRLLITDTAQLINWLSS